MVAKFLEAAKEGGPEDDKKTKVEMPLGTGASKTASLWQSRLKGEATEEDKDKEKKTKVEMPEGTGASKVASVWQTRLQGGEVTEEDKEKEKKNQSGNSRRNRSIKSSFKMANTSSRRNR